ncbi:hypothetical protein H5410_020826 [Solanum commersonii]|uniref:DUF1985 domain-containing protein n=1 Tax=Solanum commersonii TaxID=4109 RepID=A0A9J5Z9J6_SOLCO|nr:hypothetical protein H5410_020826 [Solanum commersonii]
MSIMMERKKLVSMATSITYVVKNTTELSACAPTERIKVVVAIFSTTSMVIWCDPLLQQSVVALIISSLSLLEELASEAVSSSQVEAEFSQKEYEEREKEKNEIDDDGERAEEVEEEEGNKKEVEEDKGKQKEVEEEEGKNKEVVEEEEEKINEVDEDKGKQEEVEEEEQEKNEVEDDGIKTINAHTFSVHLQPNAISDSIMRSAMGKPFNTFRITLTNSCFGHFLDFPKNNNTCFQMTMVYEFLKRRFIFQNLEKNDEDTPRKHKKSLCLLWFVHNVLLSKDLNNNISLKWVNLSQDIEAFNNYPWGCESFELTVKYLLKPLGPKTNNLFGFPWAFMAWAFEVIPHLTHQVNAEEEISSPRILRWLRSKTKTAKNIPDLYNPPYEAVSYYYITLIYVATCDPSVSTDDSYVVTYDTNVATDDPSVATCDTNVVHPWLVPTEKELQMSYLITLGLVETLFDLVVDRVKMELAGARTIKRDRVINELVVFDRGDGRDIDVGAGAGQDQGATSCRRCSGFLCEKCKKQDEDSIIQEEEKYFIKAIQNLKKKIFGELPMAVGEEVLEFKHVNVYKRVTIAEKNKLADLTRAKELCVQYSMHFFSGEDFRTMTSMDIWWEDWYVDEILSLIRERHVRYPEYYDSTDISLNRDFIFIENEEGREWPTMMPEISELTWHLNFYSNFKLRYDKISEEATTVGGRSFTQLINEFEWDEDMINYVKGIRPYPGGMDWISAKRLLAVMNLNKTHFVTLEILLHEGRMNVYDCLLMGMEHTKFLTFIQPVFELLPKLLKQSGIMKHLPDNFLNEPWEFKGRLEPMYLGAWSLNNVFVIKDNVLFDHPQQEHAET